MCQRSSHLRRPAGNLWWRYAVSLFCSYVNVMPSWICLYASVWERERDGARRERERASESVACQKRLTRRLSNIDCMNFISICTHLYKYHIFYILYAMNKKMYWDLKFIFSYYRIKKIFLGEISGWVGKNKMTILSLHFNKENQLRIKL